MYISEGKRWNTEVKANKKTSKLEENIIRDIEILEKRIINEDKNQLDEETHLKLKKMKENLEEIRYRKIRRVNFKSRACWSEGKKKGSEYEKTV